MLKITLKTIILFSIIFTFSFAQKTITNPAADDILIKVISTVEGISDFTVAIEAEIQMERVQIPKMKATMFFKKPDKLHFNSDGFLAIPREGMVLNPALFRERYTVNSMFQDTIRGIQNWKLILNAKDHKSQKRDIILWINPENWTISKLETIPYEGRVIVVNFFYMFIQEKYWLVSKMEARFTSESESPAFDTLPLAEQQSEVMQRTIPRSGVITISYSDYKINTGLSDEIFARKEKR